MMYVQHKSLVLVSFLFVILLLLFQNVIAEPFSVSATESEATVTGDAPATFSFLLSNPSNTRLNVTLQVSTTAWTAAFSPAVVELKEKGSAQLSLTLTPVQNAFFGTHDLTVRFIAGSDVVEHTLRINRRDPNPREPIYLSTDSQIPQKIDPNYALDLKLVVINQENIPKRDVGVRVTAGDFLSASTDIDLAPYERKEIPLAVTMPPGTKPQDAELKIFFVEHNSIVAEFTRPLTILPIELELQEKEEERTGFLTREVIYKVHNPSNIPKTATFTTEHISFFGRIFSSSIPEARFDRASKSYAWDLSLEGDAVVELVVKYNYRGIFYIIIGVIIILIIFHYLKPDIFISKSISKVSYHDDGTLAGAKILVHLKNKTRETIRDIAVVETIPEIAHYQQKSIAGSLEPDSIKQLEHTALVTWKIDELSPSEERFVVYQIRLRLGVVGSLTLPASKIRFVKNGRKYSIYSNVVVVPAKESPK